MVVITKKKGDTKDSILRKFTRTFIEEDIVNQVRDRQFYKKPSLLRKEKAKLRLQNRHRSK